MIVVGIIDDTDVVVVVAIVVGRFLLLCHWIKAWLLSATILELLVLKYIKT